MEAGVIRVIELPSKRRSASLHKIVKLDAFGVHLDGDRSLQYSPTTGDEIDPQLPGCRSYIVHIE